MMAKSVSSVSMSNDTFERAPFDWVKWIIWGSIALAIAVGLFGVAFLVGYLSAFHNAATTIQHDHALIVSLNQKLQTTHALLANHSASTS